MKLIDELRAGAAAIGQFVEGLEAGTPPETKAALAQAKTDAETAAASLEGVAPQIAEAAFNAAMSFIPGGSNADALADPVIALIMQKLLGQHSNPAVVLAQLAAPAGQPAGQAPISVTVLNPPSPTPLQLTPVDEEPAPETTPPAEVEPVPVEEAPQEDPPPPDTGQGPLQTAH